MILSDFRTFGLVSESWHTGGTPVGPIQNLKTSIGKRKNVGRLYWVLDDVGTTTEQNIWVPLQLRHFETI